MFYHVIGLRGFLGASRCLSIDTKVMDVKVIDTKAIVLVGLVVDKSHFRYAQLSRSEKGQILLQQQPQWGHKIYAEGVAPFESVTLEQAASFWALELSIGNQKALGLVIASTAEALERRADKAFGVEVNETRRNEVFQERQAPPVTIKERKRRQKALDALYRAENPFSSLGKESTVKINLAVFGVKHFKCDRSTNMSKESQRAIAEIELYIFHQRLQRPLVDLVSIVDEAIEIHKIAYGDKYFLVQSK